MRDCGAACLAMVAKHYGMSLPITKCRELTKTDKIGTNLYGLVDGAEKIGFKIRESRLDKVPYMLVVGQKEEEEQTVSMRSRYDGDAGSMKLDSFIDQICKEIRTKEIRKVLEDQ